jgi:hypothetical protein
MDWKNLKLERFMYAAVSTKSRKPCPPYMTLDNRQNIATFLEENRKALDGKSMHEDATMMQRSCASAWAHNVIVDFIQARCARICPLVLGSGPWDSTSNNYST